MRRFLLILLALAVVLLAYPTWLALQIWEQSRRNELPRHADVIVILGAAQYNGRPSPVFKARLDHAAYLYEEGFSGMLIVTGGKRAGDNFTEAGTGEMYLETAGIPSDDILIENEGRTSLESLRNVSTLAAEKDLESVLLVSDPLHSERIKRMARDLHFEDVHASPASYLQLQRSRSKKASQLLREVASLAAYELLDQDERR